MVNNVFVLFDCPIILGGYIGGYLGEYLEELRERILPDINIFGVDVGNIKTCGYQVESIAAGSALHFVASFLKSI